MRRFRINCNSPSQKNGQKIQIITLEIKRMTNSSTNNLISHDIENSPSKTPIKTNWPRKFLPFIEALSFGKWSKIQIHQTWDKKDNKSQKKTNLIYHVRKLPP